MIPLLAHQGGWDEILLTAGLVLLLLGFSRLRRRAAANRTPPTRPRPPSADDVCAYCGASLERDAVRCSSCGFRRGEAAG